MDDIKNGQRRDVPGIYEDGIKVRGLADGRFPPGGLAQGYLDARKVPSFRFDGSGRSFQTASVVEQRAIAHADGGLKQGGDWFSDPTSASRTSSSKSSARKAASARIARIPFALSSWIGAVYLPRPEPHP